MSLVGVLTFLSSVAEIFLFSSENRTNTDVTSHEKSNLIGSDWLRAEGAEPDVGRQPSAKNQKQILRGDRAAAQNDTCTGYGFSRDLVERGKLFGF
jgi:hypothetical protein